MGCNCQKTPTEQDVKKIAELDQYIDSLLAGTSDERRSGFLIQILHRLRACSDSCQKKLRSMSQKNLEYLSQKFTA